MTTRYTTLTYTQLFILAIIVGLISAGLVLAAMRYEQLKLLPEVAVTPGGECIKVTNYENGHAFGCPDVDVLLRKYRKTVTGNENQDNPTH